MPQVYDNWERLVRATLRREQLRLIGQRTPSDLSLASSSSFNFGASSRREISSIKLLRLSIGEVFEYDHILRTSNSFTKSNLIAQGHSGDLFFGVLDNEIPVVVKKIDFSLTAMEAFCLRELEFYGRAKVTHSRFVPLLGHCSDVLNNQLFLVYKYMPNVDLASSLFRGPEDVKEYSLRSLDWITRLKIATGVAEALSYLHHECSPPLVHGPPITIKSRPGIPNASCTYDVYCFGKVLLELVTGKLGISSASGKDWLEQLLPYITIHDYDQELIVKIVDPSLVMYEDLLEEVWSMAVVARACLNPKPSGRPLIRNVLKALESPLEVVRVDYPDRTRLVETSPISPRNDIMLGSSWGSSLDLAAKPVALSASVAPSNLAAKPVQRRRIVPPAFLK